MDAQDPLAGKAGSFYRRPLPEGLIAFGSGEGRLLFREALAAGTMEGWFALAEQFHTQADPAFCGLGTLVVALNALEIDPGRIWKGPWRWYGEELLDCCVPLGHVQKNGVTLDELACLSRCNGASARVERADRAGVERLRHDVAASAAAPRGPVLVAGYSRKELGQTGSGHFSPVGGYHAGRDLVLVLDVARFKYPPHWVPLERLWQAMTAVDPATGRARGWIVLERGQQRTTTLFFRLTAGDGLGTLVATLLQEAPALLAAAPGETPEALIASWIAAAEGQIGDRICQSFGGQPAATATLPAEHRAAIETLLGQLHATPLYRAIAASRPPGQRARVPDELLAVLLLSLPDAALAQHGPRAATLLAPLRDAAHLGRVLAEEISALREQLTELRRWESPGVTAR
jgi:glutathione gamma-glutamylcysteinyltransferase